MTGGPLIHLICGSTDAGKTTYAMALTERIGGAEASQSPRLQPAGGSGPGAG